MGVPNWKFMGVPNFMLNLPLNALKLPSCLVEIFNSMYMSKNPAGREYMTVIKLDQTQRPHPDSRDGKGRTQLHKLCSHFVVCAVDLQQALKAGCNVNAVDNWGDTPLHTLIESIMDNAARAECMSILIKAGADVNARGNMGMTPLNLAVKRDRTDCVRDLLQAKADINARDKYGNTPLYEAVIQRNTDMLTLLLEHGADANIRDKYGQTLLQMAESERNIACAQVLRQYDAEVDESAEACAPVVSVMTDTGAEAVDSNESGPEPETEPGDIAASGYSAVKPTNINQRSNQNARDGKGRTPLHGLCASYNVTAGDLRQALKAGADVNAVDNWGNTPLHSLVSGGSDNKAELIGVLIEAGANVDEVNCRNRTALFDAVDREDMDCIQALLQAGANVNARDEIGNTSLHWATWNRDTILLRLLLEHGAAVNTRNRLFETPLRLAQRQNNYACAQLLREYGAYAGIAGQLAMMLRRITKFGTPIN